MPENDLTTLEAPISDDLERERQSRLKELEDIYLDISSAHEDGRINIHSMRAIQHGESLRLCLNEILELREPTAEEVRLNELREEYLDTQFVKARLITPAQRRAYDEKSDRLQVDYVDAVVAKIAKAIEAQTPQEALEVGQLHPVVRKASFIDGVTISMEQFAANHLYLLVDAALKEQYARQEVIQEHRNRSLRARVASSRGARLAIGGAIGAASLAPELSFVPRPEEVITQDLELALKGLSGLIIGVNLPEFVRLQLLSRGQRKQNKYYYDKLSETELCDQALRIIYGSARYGGYTAETMVTGRHGTKNKRENLRRLQVSKYNFPHLNNDPGGKPYSSTQAINYAGRLLIEKREELEEIIDPSKSAEEQQKLFLRLCQEMLTEDVRRMKRRLNVTAPTRAIMAALGIVPAVIFPAATTATNDAATLSEDTLGLIQFKSKDSADSEP